MENINIKRLVKDAQNLISDIELDLGPIFTFEEYFNNTVKYVQTPIDRVAKPLIGALNALCYYDGDEAQFKIVYDERIKGYDLTHLILHETVHIRRGHVDKSHPLTYKKIMETLEQDGGLEALAGVACFAHSSKNDIREYSVELAAIRLDQRIKTDKERRISSVLGEWTGF